MNINLFTPVSSLSTLLVPPFNDTGYAIWIISTGSSDGIIKFQSGLDGL